jgi:hypothetical protein
VRVYEANNATSLAELNQNRVKVTPSFAETSVNINGNSNETYQIISLQGVVMASNIENGELNISDWQKGLYFVCLNGERVGSFIKR